MLLLAIETSCDETAAAIIYAKKNSRSVTLLSNVVVSSLELHAKTGGIIPEIAARQQIEYILPVIEKTLRLTPGVDSQNPAVSINAIAVTYGPGLIGSLLVGVETAKTLAYVWNKPLIPVNHLLGHIYANFISEKSNVKSPAKGETRQGRQMSKVEFPAIALIVSGGHTDLLLMKHHQDFEWLGGTRDDAAGEAFDKIGRLLGLPYPAGPAIEKYAQKGNPKRFSFPCPLIDSNDFDFSFSGLKTAVFREVKKIEKMEPQTIADICAGVQNAIIDVLITKTLKAIKQSGAKSILLGGGVAANSKLRQELKRKMKNDKWQIKLFAPAKSLCTDNAAMIAAAAFFQHHPIPLKKLTANPELYFDNTAAS